MPVEAEADEDQQADDAEEDADGHAEEAGLALRGGGNSDAPFIEKIPDADAEVERRSDDTDGHEGEEPGVGEELLDVGVGGTAVSGPALGVEMPTYIDEGDETSVALRGIEPVADPGVGRDVGLAAHPDVNAVEAVVEDGEKDGGPFDEGAIRDSLEFLRDGIVLFGTDESGAVGVKMFGKESADGKDARERMKFAKKITCVRPGCR